jgi:hypothetical protein
VSVTVVTFKDEDCDDDGAPIGPVVVIRAEGKDAEAGAAAGVPFRYEPEQAERLGWKSYREAVAIAGAHGVPLTEW